MINDNLIGQLHHYPIARIKVMDSQPTVSVVHSCLIFGLQTFSLTIIHPFSNLRDFFDWMIIDQESISIWSCFWILFGIFETNEEFWYHLSSSGTFVRSCTPSFSLSLGCTRFPWHQCKPEVGIAVENVIVVVECNFEFNLVLNLIFIPSAHVMLWYMYFCFCLWW